MILMVMMKLTRKLWRSTTRLKLSESKVLMLMMKFLRLSMIKTCCSTSEALDKISNVSLHILESFPSIFSLPTLCVIPVKLISISQGVWSQLSLVETKPTEDYQMNSRRKTTAFLIIQRMLTRNLFLLLLSCILLSISLEKCGGSSTRAISKWWPQAMIDCSNQLIQKQQLCSLSFMLLLLVRHGSWKVKLLGKLSQLVLMNLEQLDLSCVCGW